MKAALLKAMILIGIGATFINPVGAEEAQPAHGKRWPASNPKWQKECSACHLAYPPRFLPAESWRKLMASLDQHFGENASLDGATTQEITDFLVQNARRRRTPEAPLRITESRWFKHEHDEIRPETWKNPKVGSPANCGACHQDADQGRFSEHKVRIPR